MEEGGDWDLQAVVRSCSGGSTTSRPQTQYQDHNLSLPLPNQQEETETEQEKDMFFIQNPDFFLPQTSLQELDDLYKPFFPKSQTQIKIPKEEQPKVSQTCSGGVSVLQQKPNQRSKRRKIQQKRVVCHVPADGLSADMWAWRKYGQKPIKGSPHPRGYYKCSSSKGCPARKQVERSTTDQNIFIITYTSEHNHSVPTHRNSLAGSTRQKFPQPPTSTTSTSTSQQTPSLSPTTPLAEQEGEVVEEEEGEGVLLVSEMEILADDDILFLEDTS